MELDRMDEIISQLPKEQKKAILQLIDLKTEQDMKEFTKTMETFKESMDFKFKEIDTKFEAQNSKFNMIFWALGIMMTIILALKLFG